MKLLSLPMKPLRKIRKAYKVALIEKCRLKKLEKFHSRQSNARHLQGAKKKNIVFNTQYPWHYAWVDYILARALSQHGHQVSMMLCDGLPYCEQETNTTARPDCASCFARSLRQCEAFQLPYHRVSDTLSERDHQIAKDIAENTSVENLLTYQYQDIPIGDISYRNLAHYFKGIVEIEGEIENKFRQIFKSAYLLAVATSKSKPMTDCDIVVSTNGKFIQSGIGVDHAFNLKKEIYTWEVFNQFSAAIFAHNGIALEQKIDDLWDAEKDKPLTEAERNQLYRNFKAQSESKNTPFQYVDDKTVSDRAAIIQQYKLNPDKPILVLFPNVEWDSTAMIASGFDSMMHWIKTAIDYAIAHPDHQLIIRAHPGELKVPTHLKTTTPICDRIRASYQSLPSNVFLFDPYESVSSYTLAEIADVVMVYTSTMGLEFALRGIKPWVCAYSYYYGKGFTCDINGPSEMVKMLEQKAFGLKLSNEEIVLAERLAYIVRYRRLFTFPYFDQKGFDFKAYQSPKAEDEKIIENITALILGQRHYLDLGEATW